MQFDPHMRDAFAHLPRLVVFAEVARRGSFREAAEALGLSPSTVSHHIKELEAFLRVKLIERTSRSMTLTSAGRELVAATDQLVQVWNEGTSLARLHTDEPVGTLVVTAPDVFTEHVVVPVATRLLEHYPQLKIVIRPTSANLDLVAEGIDVAVRRGPLPDSNLGARLLVDDRYGIFASPQLAMAWPCHHPTALLDAPWVCLAVRSRSEHPKLLHDSGERFTLKVDYRARVSTPGVFLEMMTQSAGFGLFPCTLAQHLVAQHKLVSILPHWSGQQSARFYAVTPSPRPTDAKVVYFIESLLQSFTSRG
ncbi:MAG: LysR family transcriptional regulator [Myxococcota bacterium]